MPWKPLHQTWQIYIYISVQIQIYPCFQMRWTTETESRNDSIFSHKVFRFRYTPPFQIRWTTETKTIFSEEVFRFRYTPVFQIRWTTETKTRNESIFSHSFQIQIYSPLLQIRWTTETKARNEFICSCSIVIFNYCHPTSSLQDTIFIRSFVCNTKRPSVKQSIKWQVCSNFQMKYPDKLSDIPPKQNCQWQEMKSSLIYVVNESPFETDGRIRSSFQMKCTARSTCQMKYPDKLSDIPPKIRWHVQMAELGQVFRWSAQVGQLVRWSTQIYPTGFRWSAHWDSNPKWGNEFIFSDEVFR